MTLRLRYTKHDGSPAELVLSERPITIGRNPDSDVVLIDEKVSRIHCGIRLWDGEYYLKDLKSRNGTFVNGRRIEVATLKPGDQVRIGSTDFFLDGESGSTTALQEIKGEMESGKGYSTILREIVHDVPRPDAEDAAQEAPRDKSQKPVMKVAGKKPARIILKKKS
jgi:pSer/pThr/pTyr-binding forkhead associated (FHA) protein